MHKSTDFLAGVFVLASLLLMMWATVILGGHQAALKELIMGSVNKEIIIKFDNISGLEVNHAVKVQGHEFGKVVKIDMNDKGDLLVTAKMQDRIPVYEGYQIQIKDESMLGGKAIYIEIGDKNRSKITGLYQEDAPILLGNTSGNLMMEGGDILSANRDDIRKIVQNIKTISEEVKSITEKVNQGDGLAGRVINDAELADNVKNAVANLNTMIQKVKDGEGFLGRLINDDKMYQDLQKILKEAQSALEDVREQAPISTFAGAVLGAF